MMGAPRTDDQLADYIYVMLGVKFPRTSVCPGHVAPFQALADAYFSRYPVTVWKASRGFGGKSYMLAALSLVEAIGQAAHVNLLGGSAAQSLNVHEHTRMFWDWPYAPRYLIARDSAYLTKLSHGGYLRALMASQRSVRGPHPQKLRLDEIDEMDIEILDASLGQPMESPTVQTQVVMSSTHQYPDKTMSVILERAEDKGWPVMTWCYRENLTTNGGWLTPQAVERKRHEVTARMFEVEYDLQEPSLGDRAFDTEAVDACYSGVWCEGMPGKEYRFEPYVPGAVYVHGVDWAKRQDMTVIDTWRTDETPWRRVAWQQVNRLPWPSIIHQLHMRVEAYPGAVTHDATGVGDVVADHLDLEHVEGIVMTGRRRVELFSDYIQAMENGQFVSPKIGPAYNEHKYCSVEALFGKEHPPDSVVAGAMAWAGRDRIPQVHGMVSLGGKSYWRRNF